MLEISQISKSFPGKNEPVLSNISFSISSGEAVALIGENGAGKTTLIKILSMILKPDSGYFSLDDVRSIESPEFFKYKTGTLFSGDGSLYDRLTAEENIIYQAKLNGISKKKYLTTLERLTSELALSDFLKNRVSTFSRGMKQRTSIAKALITDPEFIILDEPSTGLDITACESVKRIISRLKSSGRTVLFSSHNTDEVFTCADKIVVLHKGKINCNKPSCSYISEHGRDLSVYIGSQK